MIKLIRRLVRRALFGSLINFIFEDGYKTGGVPAQLRNLIRIGTVVSRENKYGSQAGVTWLDKGLNGVTSGLMPVIQKSSFGWKTFFVPRAGDQVISIHDPDAPEHGWILGTLNSTVTPGPISSDQNGPAYTPQSLNSHGASSDDGVVFDYDPDSSTLLVKGPIKNINISGITGPTTISSSSTCSLKFSQMTVDSPVEFKQAVTMDSTLTVTGTTLLNGGGTATPNLVNSDGSGDGS